MVRKAGIYLFLIVMVIFNLFPIIWALSTSLKQFSQAVSYPPTWIPDPPTIENYKIVLFESNMPKYILNSIFVAISVVVCVLLVASHAGYAGARFCKTKGIEIALLFVLFSSMIPEISYLVPLYGMVIRLGLHDTYLGLIIVHSARWTPIAAWLMRGFFEAVPKELEEAAQIEGCSRLQSVYYITFPLARPGLAAVAIYTFVMVWNDFLFAFTLTISDAMRLLQVGLYHYITAFGVEWHSLTTALIIALLPAVVVFLFFQKHFIHGLITGAGK